MGVEEQGIARSHNRYKVIPRVLVFITYESDILLLKGAPDKRLWPNLYNGVGGHIERGESPLDTVLREVEEEVGLTELHDVRLRGVVNIATDDVTTGILMFVYTAVSPSRHVTASREGTPEWIDPTQLDRNACVADLPALIPRVLGMSPSTPPFSANYWYDENDELNMTFS